MGLENVERKLETKTLNKTPDQRYAFETLRDRQSRNGGKGLRNGAEFKNLTFYLYEMIVVTHLQRSLVPHKQRSKELLLFLILLCLFRWRCRRNRLAISSFGGRFHAEALDVRLDQPEDQLLVLHIAGIQAKTNRDWIKGVEHHVTATLCMILFVEGEDNLALDALHTVLAILVRL